jgi:hypothetical protein
MVIAIAVFAAGCFGGPPSSGTSPYHDDPFLTCVRQWESGNRYWIDSPGGLYHGAYQFHQLTWDATAQRVGRFDLVGVDPHTASAAAQDDLAWALYQWQGTSPWPNAPC